MGAWRWLIDVVSECPLDSRTVHTKTFTHFLNLCLNLQPRRALTLPMIATCVSQPHAFRQSINYQLDPYQGSISREHPDCQSGIGRIFFYYVVIHDIPF